MTSKRRDEQLITETSLQEYFQTSLSDALENQKVKAGADTIHYVVSLLTSFSRAEKLFDRTPDGWLPTAAACQPGSPCGPATSSSWGMTMRSA